MLPWKQNDSLGKSMHIFVLSSYDEKNIGVHFISVRTKRHNALKSYKQDFLYIKRYKQCNKEI